MGQVCIKVVGLLQVSVLVNAKHQWTTRLYPKAKQTVLYILEDISVCLDPVFASLHTLDVMQTYCLFFNDSISFTVYPNAVHAVVTEQKEINLKKQ